MFLCVHFLKKRVRKSYQDCKLTMSVKGGIRKDKATIKAPCLSIRLLWFACLYSIGFDIAEMLKSFLIILCPAFIYRSKHNRKDILLVESSPEDSRPRASGQQPDPQKMNIATETGREFEEDQRHGATGNATTSAATSDHSRRRSLNAGYASPNMCCAYPVIDYPRQR